MAFIIGAILLVVGMMFFTLGAEMSMTPMGERIGTRIAQSKRLPVIIGLCFVLGFIITISEPDLQVLAGQVPSVSNMTLILAVAVGVGIFLVAAVLRMLFSKPLSYMLLIFYPVVFILTFFVSKDFLAIAFDSGGVTTGPMTVPFIMALGIGFSAVRSDKYAETDSFGLVSLCSIGPVLAVLLLGIIYHPQGGSYSETVIPDAETSVALWKLFESGIPHYMKEIGGSLLPIILFFTFFQVVSLKLKKKTLIKILVGILYTYIGLVLFLTGVNVGFMPVGNYLGQVIAGLPYRWVIIPIGMLIGYFIVKAEPAVYVLMEQVEELTSGAISGKAMGYSLSLGVAFSLGLAMIRVLTGISILWFLVPGYALALILTLFVPKIFTAIAFDSGGVASGPMTATFLLPFAQGACEAVGGNVVTDAFGVVAMVAMTPLITIQILGVVYQYQERKKNKEEMLAEPVKVLPLEAYGDADIIELYLAAGVGRVAQDERLGVLAEGLLEHVCVKMEIGRHKRHIDRLCAGQDGVCTVVFVKRGEDDDLVARIGHGHHRRHHGFRAAAGRDDLGIRVDGASHQARLLGGQRLAEVLCTKGHSVLVRAGIGCPCQRVQQLLRRVKIRKTLRQVDGVILIIDAGHAADDRIRKGAHTVT